MSWQAAGWVAAEVRGLTPSQRMVLLTMANYVDPEGFGCFAGRARLADEVELSERQVQRICDELERMGLVERGDPEIARVALSKARSKDGRPRPVPRRLPVVWNLMMGRSRIALLDVDRPPIGSVSTSETSDSDRAASEARPPGSGPKGSLQVEWDNVSRSAGSDDRTRESSQVREPDNSSHSVTRHFVGRVGHADGTAVVRTGHRRRSERDIQGSQNRTQDVSHNKHPRTNEHPTSEEAAIHTPEVPESMRQYGADGREVAVEAHPASNDPQLECDPGSLADTLARAVGQALPLTLSRSISWQALRSACAPLIGLSEETLTEAVKRHSWEGARAGAVIAWLRRDAASRGDMAVHAPTRPPWCGECDDERTRLVDAGEGKVRRCPRCHPQLRSSPAKVQAGSARVTSTYM